MNLDKHYSGRENGSRKKHFFDQENPDHKEIEKAALVFRRALYDYASSLFTKSPFLLKQLSPKAIGAKGDGLVLFGIDTPPRIKNAKHVVLKFLVERAHCLVYKDEKDNIKMLINFVNSFNIEKEEI